jgi:hypothetical protein
MSLQSALRWIAIAMALALLMYGVVVLDNLGPQDATSLIKLGYVGLSGAAATGGCLAYAGRLGLAATSLAISLTLVPLLLAGGIACCLD